MKQQAYIDSFKAVIKHPNLLRNRFAAPDHTSFHRRFAYIDRHVVITFVDSTVSLEHVKASVRSKNKDFSRIFECH